MSLEWLNPEQRQAALGLFQERFGIPPSCFDDYLLGRRGDGIYALAAAAAEGAGHLQWVSAGLLLLRVKQGGSLRPTTRALQVFGRWATQRLCDLDDDGLRALLRGASLPWPGERGTVLLRWRGQPVGLGVLRNDQLVGQLPRSVTEHLQTVADQALC